MTADKVGTLIAIVVVVVIVGITMRFTRSPYPAFALAVGILLSVIAISWGWQLQFRQGLTLFFAMFFGVVVVLTCYGAVHRARYAGTVPEPVTHFEEVVSGTGSHERLFVLIHGFVGGPKTWRDIEPALLQYGDVVQLNYDADTNSDTDPVALAKRMAGEINAVHSSKGYREIVLIGHSVGSLIARQTYLVAAKDPSAHPWIVVNKRIVLLAGMNRGWDISGEKPLDMSQGKRFVYWAATWFGRLTDRGSFIRGAETGAPFVSNLRLEWMKWFRTHPDPPIVVQLLGDIDDVVSDEDNKDLRASAADNFYWLRVRGTGHSDIVIFKEGRWGHLSETPLGAYRKQKILLAATRPSAEIEAEMEEQGFRTDPTVRHIVFVLHGIRDLGEWSAEFEQSLRKAPGAPTEGRLLVVSARYGYFSMASFVFRPDRQKYVRWFMDQYTETLARYPAATTIDFIGHSNGTYLLASALQQYESLKVRRIVFAGSVVRISYDWEKVFQRGQVEAVRNYVATGDWVVGFFPRFFDTWMTRWAGNDVGAAGIEGFATGPGLWVEDVAISGGHGAFLRFVPEITQFVTRPTTGDRAASTKIQAEGFWERVVASRFAFPFVWAGLAILVVYPGIRVAIAGGQFAWIPMFLYAALVVAILSRI